MSQYDLELWYKAILVRRKQNHADMFVFDSFVGSIEKRQIVQRTNDLDL